MNKRIKIILLISLLIIELICLIKIKENKYNKNIEIINQDVIINEENLNVSSIEEEWLLEKPDSPVIKYAATALNFRIKPNIDSDILDTFEINQELTQLKEWNEDWSKVKNNEQIGFVYTKYLSDEKIIIEEPKIVITENSDDNIEVAETIDSNGLTYLGVYNVSAYCGCVRCNEGYRNNITASGATARANHTVAAPPSIQFGTRLLINGQEYVVEDRGGAIKGNKLDIFFDSHSEANSFGRQYLDVYRIE